MERHITIQHGKIDLTATLHYPDMNEGEECSRYPIMIICHGFIGSRIGVNRLFVKAAREFSSNGYMVLRFDYSGCGESSGDYGTTTFDSLIQQTRTVLNYALSIDCVDPKRVILLGHSLGGAVSILTAAKDKRVKTLVLWAPVAHPLTDIVRITGKHVYEKCMKDGSADYLGYSFQATFFDSLSEFQPFQEAQKFNGNVLLVHGTADDDIPVDYTFLYQKVYWMRNEGQCDKEVIFQADHTFSSGESAGQAIHHTRDWLKYMEKKKTEWHDWTI